MPNKDYLMDEKDLPKDAEFIERPPITSAGVPPIIRDRYQGGVVNDLGLDTDTANSQLSGSLPTYRLMPTAPSGNAATNAAIQSTSRAFPAVAAAAPSGTVTLNIPNIFTPVTQTITPPGTLAVALATEVAGTVWAGPPAGAVGFDASFFGSTFGTGAGGTLGVAGDTLSTASEWALYASAAQGTSFTGITPSAGWTTLAGDGTTGRQRIMNITAPLSVTDTFSGTGNVAGIIAYFAGTIPTIVQSISGSSGGTSTVSGIFSGNTVAGHAVLVIAHSTIFSGDAAPLLVTCSDSQGNTGILIASAAQGFGASSGAGTQVSVFLIPNVKSAAETVNVSTPAAANGSNPGVLWCYEITAPPAIAAIPRFRSIGTTDLGGATGGGPFVLEFNPTISNPTILGLIPSYNGIATVGNGVPVEYAKVDLTNQSAAIGATTIYTPPVANGFYRISAYLKVTTVDATSSTLGPLTIKFTDGLDVSAQSCVMLMGDQTGAAAISNSGNTTTSVLTGSMSFFQHAGSLIQFTVGYASNVAATMRYEVRLRLEAM